MHFFSRISHISYGATMLCARYTGLLDVRKVRVSLMKIP